MIIVIRISGMVNVPKGIEESMHRIRLRRKYSAVLIKPSTENLCLLKEIRNHVAFGKIDKETLIELIKKRAEPLKGIRLDAEKVISGLEKKTVSDLGIKPFFRLHPPRGGIDSKKHFGINKGVLGDNEEKINDLIRRML